MRRALVVTVLILAGCTNDPAPAAKPTLAPSSAAVSASPTKGTITREAAAQQYLRLAAPSNAVGDAVNAKCLADWKFLDEGGSSEKTSSERLANMKDCDIKYVASIRSWVAAMRAATWPPEIATDLENALKYNEAVAYAFDRRIKAQNEEEYQKASAAIPADDGSADLVRARLGLPTRSPKG